MCDVRNTATYPRQRQKCEVRNSARIAWQCSGHRISEYAKVRNTAMFAWQCSGHRITEFAEVRNAAMFAWQCSGPQQIQLCDVWNSAKQYWQYSGHRLSEYVEILPGSTGTIPDITGIISIYYLIKNTLLTSYKTHLMTNRTIFMEIRDRVNFHYEDLL